MTDHLHPIGRTGLRALLPLLALAAAFATVGCSRSVPWEELALDDALQRARQEDRVLMLDVYATWCGPCRRLEEEVWHSAAGARLSSTLLPLKVDFDLPEGQDAKRRYRVLSLPTVLFLRADGTEIDRIEGYGGKEEFLEAALPFARGEGRLEEAMAAHRADLEDPVAALRLGHLLLVRGDEEGERLLREAVRLDPDDGASAASEALFTLGRYYTRAVERPAEGIGAWRELHDRFRESDYGGVALYWVLKSHDAAGSLEAGIASLGESGVVARPEDCLQAVHYLLKAEEDAFAMRLLMEGLVRFPDSGELEELRAEMG